LVCAVAGAWPYGRRGNLLAAARGHETMILRAGRGGLQPWPKPVPGPQDAIESESQ
jgi:hypothetical protein